MDDSEVLITMSGACEFLCKVVSESEHQNATSCWHEHTGWLKELVAIMRAFAADGEKRAAKVKVVERSTRTAKH